MNYYRDELYTMIEQWPDEKLQNYIIELQMRLANTQEHIRALKAIKRRRGRNKNLKETGTRGGA